jgi:ribosomal-protein-serine acetyltransferase
MRDYYFELKINQQLSLVIPRLSNAKEIYRLIDNDREHLRQWLPFTDSTQSVEDVRKNLIDRIETFDRNEQAAFYGTLNGEFVASVGFVKLENTDGEIGYWLLSQYQGKGLVTAFVKACIEYGFSELNLSTIAIKCDEGNTKSAAIPLRLGFVQIEKTETTRFRNENDHQTLIFTLDRKDWST